MRAIVLTAVVVLSGCAGPTMPSSAPASPPLESAPHASVAGVSRNEAVTLARDAVSVVSDEWVVALAESGPLERIRPGWEEQEWGQGLSAELSVWRVMLVDGEVTAEVVIDALSGSVYGSVVGIDN